MVYWRHRITEVRGQYRITIPKDLVKEFGWEKGEVVMIHRYVPGMIIIETTAKEGTVESGISKRKNGSDRSSGGSGKVGGSKSGNRKPGRFHTGKRFAAAD